MATKSFSPQMAEFVTSASDEIAGDNDRVGARRDPSCPQRIFHFLLYPLPGPEPQSENKILELSGHLITAQSRVSQTMACELF